MWTWLNRFRVNKKRSVFIKFLFSYLFILLIPIVIGTHEYYKTQGVLVDDATELNQQILKMSQDTVDRLFLEADDVATSLSVDNNVLTQMQSEQTPLSAEEIYNFSLLRTELNQYKSTNKLFFDIDVYFANSNAVVTSRTAFDLSENNIQIGNQTLRDWINDVSKRSNQKRFYNLNSVSYGGESYKLIAYVSPLPDGAQGSVQGAIIVFINQQDISSLFQSLVVKNKGFAYIMDSQGQLIAPTTSTGISTVNPITLPNDSGAGSAFRQLSGNQMLVSYSRSEVNGWTYITALPSSAVLVKAEYIKRMILFITLITLVVGGIMAFLLARRHSKPLSELMDSMKEFVQGDNGARSNVYDTLQKAVLDILNHNQILNTRMDQQLSLVQMAVIERLMKGDYKTEQEIKGFLAQAKLMLRGERYFVIAVRIFNEDWMTIALNSVKANKELIIIGMQEVLTDYDYYICLAGDQLEIIVSIDTDDTENQLEIIKSRFMDRQSWFNGENGTLSAIGIGRIYSTLNEIWRSHNEACQAADYPILGDLNFVVWYEQIAQCATRYYYPLDLEIKLIHSVKHGDLDGLDKLLQHIEQLNFGDRQLSLSMMRQFHYEIKGTINKLVEQLEYSLTSFSEVLENLDSLYQNQSDLNWSELKMSLRIICTHISRNKKQKNTKQFDDMLSILQSSYMDSNFCLSSLAEKFKLSESVMSVFFKEQVGENFSEYLEKLRMDKACKLLKDTDLSINDISVQVGYNSDKTFRRAFKRAIGLQPTSYRDSLSLPTAPQAL